MCLAGAVVHVRENCITEAGRRKNKNLSEISGFFFLKVQSSSEFEFYDFHDLQLSNLEFLTRTSVLINPRTRRLAIANEFSQ